MDVINYTITEGNIEIWTLKNQSAIAHPFHIHDVQFYVLDRNGNTPPEAEQGRKDVILVKPQETVRFIAQFNDFGGDPVPFMYHCHMLIHEDGGMMGQFKVAASTGIEDPSVKEKLNYSIYPNPAKDFITIVSAKKMAENITIDVVDMNAKAVLTADFQSRASIILNISSLKSGVYSLIIRSYNTQETKKLIVK
jgi:bilirubin oxidase